MSKFSDPADNLVHEGRCYVDAQLNGVKLRTVKGLSMGTSAITALLLLIVLGGALLITLSFAFVLLLGELMGSYAAATFIVAGVLLLILVLCIVLRKKLFRNTFLPVYLDILSPEDRDATTLEELDVAIQANDTRVSKQETLLNQSFVQAQKYYTPKRLMNEGLHRLGENERRRKNSGFSLRNLLFSLGKMVLRKKK